MKRSAQIAVLAATLACDRKEPTIETTEVAPDTALTSVVAAEPGTLEPWVAEIRAGIRELPARVTLDPADARRRAIDLYETRQEAIEQRWGVRGSAEPDSALATAVMAAEGSFHDLLALLNRPAPPDSAAVAGAVAQLETRLDAVLEAAGVAP